MHRKIQKKTKILGGPANIGGSGEYRSSPVQSGQYRFFFQAWKSSCPKKIFFFDNYTVALRTLFGVPRGVPQMGFARGTPRGPAGYPPYEPRVRAGYVAGYPTALGYPAGYPATKSRVRNGVPRYEP